MKKLIFTLAVVFAGTVKADFSGTLLINADNTEAKLLINETMVDGNLSRLFEQMKVEETGTETKKTKSFQMSNGRFSLLCTKGFFAATPPSTSCTFVIKGGSNTDDINTFISRAGGKKFANIGMTEAFSQEFEGVFPADSTGLISYILKTGNGVSLEVEGSTQGLLSLGFSG